MDVNAPGAADRRALHRAAGGNHAELCTILIERGAEVNCPDKSGRTPLHWACISGHKEAAIILLDKGATVDAVTTSGMTSLMGAAEAGKVEVVRLLMERKADSTLKDKDGKLAFDLAMAGKHNAVVKAMKELGDPAAQSASCAIQ
ncbi:unnamed protein product [Aphanomyces euteiches]